MAKSTGPIAKVENKSGSVSTTQSIPANVGTPSASNLSAPKAERASYGHRIKDAGLGFSQDGRMNTDGVSLQTGYSPRKIKAYGASQATGQVTEVAIGPRPK